MQNASILNYLVHRLDSNQRRFLTTQLCTSLWSPAGFLDLFIRYSRDTALPTELLNTHKLAGNEGFEPSSRVSETRILATRRIPYNICGRVGRSHGVLFTTPALFFAVINGYFFGCCTPSCAILYTTTQSYRIGCTSSPNHQYKPLRPYDRSYTLRPYYRSILYWSWIFATEFGQSDRNRTCNPRIWSSVLCLLSY